jgi:hypothetical protein
MGSRRGPGSRIGAAVVAPPSGSEAELLAAKNSAQELLHRVAPGSQKTKLWRFRWSARDHGFEEIDGVEGLLIGADDQAGLHHRRLADERRQAAADLQLLQKASGSSGSEPEMTITS